MVFPYRGSSVVDSTTAAMAGAYQVSVTIEMGFSFPMTPAGIVMVLRVPVHYLCRPLDLLHLGDCIEVIAVKTSGDKGRAVQGP